MDPEVQKRYFDLRKQLSSLNYSTNFGLDAVDVIQQLFGDLISTTESYTQLQEKEYELSQDLSLAQAQLFPLKKENAKLSRENQQLHMDTVKLREELTDHQDTLVARIKELEDQLKEANFLCNCKDDAIRKGEQARIRLREAYEQLASSSLLSGGVRVKRSVKMSQSLPASGQGIPARDMLTELGFGESKSPDNGKGKGDDSGTTRMSAKKLSKTQIEADREQKEKEQEKLQEAREKEGQVISSLQKQVDTLQADLKACNEQNVKLSDQLRRREDEWLRASRQLGATDLDSGGSEAVNKSKIQNMVAADLSNQRIIEQLNGQVDFLNEHLAQREAQLAECTKELQSVRELQSESDYRGVQLAQEKENSARLTAQLRVLEARVDELQNVTNPNNRNPFRSPSPSHSRSQSRSSDKSMFSQSSTASDHSSGVDEKAQSSESDEALRALSNENRDLTEGLEQMNSTLQSMEAGDALLQGRLSRTEAARVVLRDELRTATAQLETLQEKYRESQDMLLHLQNDKEELTERLNKTQTSLEREAEAADACKGRVLELESRLSISEGTKARLEAALAELKGSMSEQRKELSSSSQAKEETDFQLKRLTQEKQNAVFVMERTQQELSMTQDKMLSLDADLMQMTESNESLERKVDVLNSQVQTAKDDLASKNADYQQLLDKYMKLDQTNREQEFSISQLQEQVNRLGESHDAVHHLSTEKDNLRHQYNELLGSSDTLSRQVKMLNKQLEAATAERLALNSQLDEKTSGCVTLQSKLDNANYEITRLEEIISQRANASTSLEGHQDSLGEKLNAATLLNTELQAEIRLVNRRLFDADSAAHQSSEALADLQISHTRATASLAKTEQSLAELEIKYEDVKSLLRQREEELSDMTSREEKLHRHELDGRRDLRVALEEKEAALKDVRDLKLLLKNMERDEKDSFSRLKRFEGKVHALQEDIDNVSSERDELKTQLRVKNAKIEELQESIRALDADRDELQNQLDDIGDEELRKQQLMSEVHQKSVDLSNLLVQRDKLIENLRRDKEHARNKMKEMEDRFRALTEENNELRRHLSLKQKEVGAAGEDLMLMTRENQSVTTELASVCHERDRLKQKVVAYSEQVTSLEHSVRALEVERGDLLETYRTCLQEKRKLEVDLGVMSESKSRLSQTINELRGDLADASAELATRRNAESRHMQERSALLLQVESLNDQLVTATRKIEDREANLDRLVRDKDGLQQTVLTLQQRSQTLVNRAASAGDTNKVLQSRVTALEREREALRNLVDSERKRSNDMAQIIAASRARDALATEEPSSLSFRSNIKSSGSGSVASNKADESTKEISSISNEEK